MERDLICYCFGYTARDIINDLRAHGRSTIFETIAAEKRAGKCHCADVNPKGG